MSSLSGGADQWAPGPTHPQAVAHVGDRDVLVDHQLVPLIEALYRRGITTIYSCQDTRPAHGKWRDDPEKPRFHVVFPDVDELRKLLPIVEQNDLLALSIHQCLGYPRWEYLLSPHGGPADPLGREPEPRLQLSVFIPVEQLDTIVETLNTERALSAD